MSEQFERLRELSDQTMHEAGEPFRGPFQSEAQYYWNILNGLAYAESINNTEELQRLAELKETFERSHPDLEDQCKATEIEFNRIHNNE